jgi:hypothetical protein
LTGKFFSLIVGSGGNVPQIEFSTTARFQRAAGRLPRVEAAGQSESVIALVAQELRHTGAGCLVRSRAVGDDVSLPGQLAPSLGDLVRVHDDRSRQPPGIGGRRFVLPDVENGDRLAPVDPLPERLH